MQTVYISLFLLTLVLLTTVANMQLRHSVLSRFELKRRSEAGSESAKAELRREVLLDDMVGLKKVAEALCLVFVVMTAGAAFGPFWGFLLSVLVVFNYGSFARWDAVRAISTRLMDYCEPKVLEMLELYPGLSKLVRSVDPPHDTAEISSREELEYLVAQSGVILTSDEKKLITNGLHFNQKTVESTMTPRGVIETIPKQELLGPLMLDTLHKTGHSRFPVIDGDLDHVVGMLHIKDLLSLGKKETETAEAAMENRVFYINQEQTLDHALAAFIKTRHHLFIVVNGYRETAGILTLEDVIEALLGREIVDEFDVHDDLRVVAARSAKENNNSTHGTNV